MYMDDAIVFYHNPVSRGRTVHWMLEEIGAPYTLRVLDFEKEEQKDPEYVAINPMGKVPAIVHRGVVVTETAAICAYLADAFPHVGLAPALDDPRRGSYLRWLFFGAGCVEPALVDRMFSRPRVAHRESLGYGSYEDVVQALERALVRGPFLCGESFTAADLYVASQIVWGTMTGALEPRHTLQAFADRCLERPASKRAMSADERLGDALAETAG
jgi:glutathione S-transferase